MAELARIHPLGDTTRASEDIAAQSGVSIAADFDRPLVQIFARNGQGAAVAKKLKISADPGQATVSKDMTALPLTTGQWILVGNAIGRKEEFTRSIAKKLGKLGFVSEQGDSRVCFRISGPKARELMSRGCRLDLHPSVVSQGFCAQTNMAQVGVLIHQSNDDPTYELYVYSGFARSFHQWLSHTAEQFN